MTAPHCIKPDSITITASIAACIGCWCVATVPTERLCENVRFGSKADVTPERPHCLLRALRLDKGRQLCTFVSDENGYQFSPIGVARVGGYEMYRARRLKERLTDIEYLDRTTFEL